MYRKVWYPNFKVMVSMKDILLHYSSSSVRATIVWCELSRYIHNRRSLCFSLLTIKNFFFFFILEKWPPEFCPHFMHECFIESPCCKGKLNDNWRMNAPSRIFFFPFPSKGNISSIGEKDQIQNKLSDFGEDWKCWNFISQ